MKFTSEDLMKAMGLQVGDRVKIDTFDYSDFEVREAYDMCNKEIVLVDDNEEMFGLTIAFGYEYEILPKRVGELKCKNYKCAECPLRFSKCTDCDIAYQYDDNATLYEILEAINVYLPDQEIYNLLKARLNKEVEE